MLVWAKAEVLDGLTGVLWSPEEESVGAGGGTEGELIEGEGLTTGSEDPGASAGGEPQSSDRELGDLQEAVVVGDSADNDNRLSLGLPSIGNKAGEGDRRPVDVGLRETLGNSLVELAGGTATQEGVEPVEQRQV